MQTFHHERLFEFIKEVFLQKKLNTEDAEQAASVLIASDLRGIDSHGIARLSGYLRLIDNGRINPRPRVQIKKEFMSTCTLDGDAGLGLIVGPKAMKIAIEKAQTSGSGFVSVMNSSHFGIAAYHSLLASSKDMIGWSMTNASPLVTPTFGKESMLGTNPICYAFPSSKEPIVIDMATSTVANGKLQIAQRLEKTIPTGWAQDEQGRETTDSHILEENGQLLPLGSTFQMGSHKGYGLSAAVDLFSGVLSGANFGPWVPPFVAFKEPLKNPPGKGIGHFFGAFRIDGFSEKETYFSNVDLWIQRFKKTKAINPNQPVLIPGEPEFVMSKKRTKKGIPINQKVLDDLVDIAKKLGIPSQEYL